MAAEAIQEALGFPLKLNVNIDLTYVNYWHRNTNAIDIQNLGGDNLPIIGRGNPDWINLGHLPTKVLGIYSEPDDSSKLNGQRIVFS
jgi:hypothetical protein